MLTTMLVWVLNLQVLASSFSDAAELLWKLMDAQDAAKAAGAAAAAGKPTSEHCECMQGTCSACNSPCAHGSPTISLKQSAAVPRVLCGRYFQVLAAVLVRDLQHTAYAVKLPC